MGMGGRPSTRNKLQYNVISSLKEVRTLCFGSREEGGSGILFGCAREYTREPHHLILSLQQSYKVGTINGS